MSQCPNIDACHWRTCNASWPQGKLVSAECSWHVASAGCVSYHSQSGHFLVATNQNRIAHSIRTSVHVSAFLRWMCTRDEKLSFQFWFFWGDSVISAQVLVTFFQQIRQPTLTSTEAVTGFGYCQNALQQIVVSISFVSCALRSAVFDCAGGWCVLSPYEDCRT